MSAVEEFVVARIAEDEESARNALDAWEAFDEFERLELRRHLTGGMLEHAERHNPARVLRLCAMIRALMRHAEDAGELDFLVDQDRAVGTRTEPMIDEVMYRDIAAIWSDHPDYRPEWSESHE